MLWSARVRAEGRREGRRARGLRGARQEAHAIFRHLLYQVGGWRLTQSYHTVRLRCAGSVNLRGIILVVAIVA